jgi:transketolase
MPSIPELQKISSQVRRDVIRMVHAAASGHPGGPLGCADFFTALYFEIMKPDPAHFTIDGAGEDIFFLSNGHLSAGWYSILARYGYFDPDELATFRKLNSRLQGHPATEEGLPGIRISSGSLGQGLSVAAGAALSKRLNHDDHRIYCLLGDGELEEGQNWEAMMFAAARKVDNLIAIVDYNGQQIDGPVENIIPLGNLKLKMEAFDWRVFEMDGNNMEELLEVMKQARSATGKGKPVIILMRTQMGHGVDFMLNNHEWHGSAPNDDLAKRALEQLEETLGDYKL